MQKNILEKTPKEEIPNELPNEMMVKFDRLNGSYVKRADGTFKLIFQKTFEKDQGEKVEAIYNPQSGKLSGVGMINIVKESGEKLDFKYSWDASKNNVKRPDWAPNNSLSSMNKLDVCLISCTIAVRSAFILGRCFFCVPAFNYSIGVVTSWSASFSYFGFN